MGSSHSSSSSSSSSQEYTDSYNTTLTNSLSGAGDLGLNTGAITGDITGNSYAYDSNNPVTNNNQSYALGANSTASPSLSSNAGSVPGNGIDWSEVVVYIIGGVVLVFILRLIGDKNA